MKILTASQVRDADAYTIQHEPIASIDLMERAANSCAEWVSEKYTVNTEINVFCGTGNNGADGLALARILSDEKYKITVYKVRYSDKCSKEFTANEERLDAISAVKQFDIMTKADIPEMDPKDLVIDAIFGSGLNRPVEGLAGHVIQAINNSQANVVAIDIPSGLFCEDNSTNNRDDIVQASHTLTFQMPKLAFMFPSNHEFVGRWSILEIGLHRKFLDEVECMNLFVTRPLAASIINVRGKFTHKGSFGHALLLAGSHGKIGAARLASEACLRSGAGLLTTYIPTCGYHILQTSVPEAMVLTDSEQNYISACPVLDGYNAIGIGPGLGTDVATASALKVLIQQTKQPLVLDADAINILGENPTWLSFVPPESIYTPHPREFERLVGKAGNDYDRHKKQVEFAQKHGVYVILKGAHTAVACPDGSTYFNSSGNPGMATAGSGDALTGVILGLLSQGYSNREACLLGVFLHGLAGDLAASDLSIESLMATDIISHLGGAFQVLSV